MIMVLLGTGAFPLLLLFTNYRNKPHMAEEAIAMLPVFITIVAFFGSGLVWTMSGYIADWRKNHNNPDWEGFDQRKLLNDMILGVILGGGVIVYQVYTGDFTGIADPKLFIETVISGVAIVAIVDKLLVKGLIGKDEA